MTWVYRYDAGRAQFEVGHYAPPDHWNHDTTHDSADTAAARVAYLNGGSDVASRVTHLERTTSGHTASIAGRVARLEQTVSRLDLKLAAMDEALASRQDDGR